MFNKLLFNTPDDRTREKQKDYRNVVLIQIIIIVGGLTLTEPVLLDSKSPESKLIITIFLLFSTTYMFLLWDLLRNFTDNRSLIITIFFVLSGIVIIGCLGEFPYYQIIDVPDRRIYLLILHGLLFPIEITVISFTIRDMFSGGFLSPVKLWGAACVYLMIGITFASLYDLITIAWPGTLGINVELGFPNYSECIRYSFSILGGVETGIEGTSHFIRNISVVEGIWGALFSMLIIGKLLGLPRQEGQQE